MRIDRQPTHKITYDDVLIIPQALVEVDSRLDVEMSTKFSRNIDISFPVVPSPMVGVVTTNMLIACSSLGTIGAIPRYIEMEEIVKMSLGLKRDNTRYGISMGMADYNLYFETIDKIIADEDRQSPLFINLDTANGGLKKVYDFVKDTLLPFCRERNLDCIVGNVATGDQAKPYFDLGVDGIRVGIGNGSACITRIVTGCGYPQLSALDEVGLVKTEGNYETTVLADGGIRGGGDIVKSLCVGTDCCMSGKIFALAMEADWNIAQIPAKNGGGVMYYMPYRGMSTYSQDRTHEGISSPIKLPPNVRPFPLELHLTDIVGGVASGFTYVGANNIKELREKYMFTLVSPAGHMEGLARE